MKKACLALVVLTGVVSTAGAWNDKGHMVVARLAWKTGVRRYRSTGS